MSEISSDDHQLRAQFHVDDASGLSAGVTCEESPPLPNSVTEDYERRIEQLWIDREVLKNMLIAGGFTEEALGRCLREAKASSELWEEAHARVLKHRRQIPAALED